MRQTKNETHSALMCECHCSSSTRFVPSQLRSVLLTYIGIWIGGVERGWGGGEGSLCLSYVDMLGWMINNNNNNNNDQQSTINHQPPTTNKSNNHPPNKDQRSTQTRLLRLPDAISPILRLKLQRRVPVDIVQHHLRRTVQVEALPTSLSFFFDSGVQQAR